MTTQVLNINQATHLQKDLGLDMSDAKMCWFRYTQPTFLKNEKWTLTFDYSNNKEIEIIECVPTYTLQEIWNKLPKEIHAKIGKLEIVQKLTLHADTGFAYESEEPIKTIDQCHRRPHGILEEYSGNPLEDGYKMLCYTIKQGYYYG